MGQTATVLATTDSFNSPYVFVTSPQAEVPDLSAKQGAQNLSNLQHFHLEVQGVFLNLLPLVVWLSLHFNEVSVDHSKILLSLPCYLCNSWQQGNNLQVLQLFAKWVTHPSSYSWGKSRFCKCASAEVRPLFKHLFMLVPRTQPLGSCVAHRDRVASIAEGNISHWPWLCKGKWKQTNTASCSSHSPQTTSAITHSHPTAGISSEEIKCQTKSNTKVVWHRVKSNGKILQPPRCTANT